MKQKIKKFILIVVFAVTLIIAGTVDYKTEQSEEQKQIQINEAMQQAQINKLSK